MRIDRRRFVQLSGWVAGGMAAGCRTVGRPGRSERIETVLGSIAPDRAGLMLPHEHVLVDFIGAAQASRDRYDRDEVIEAALPHLRRVQELGCRTLAECTPAYIGRDPLLLRDLAGASGLNLLTNTGWVEFDGISPKSLDRHVQLVSAMRERSLLGRTLVSHDAGWYHVGEPGGGTFRACDTLFTAFIPRLRETGFSESEIRQLTEQNPHDAFAIQIRGA